MPYFRQILHEKTGCASYITGCPSYGVCAVIDPLEDVDTYIKIAEDEGFEITDVIDTHIHADHVSGARKLAEKTRAVLHFHESAEVEYNFEPLQENFRVGNRFVNIIHTPGHTPESVCLLIDGGLLLTGDTLFVGSVGRPDLHGKAKELSEKLFESIQQLKKLEDYVALFPGHYGHSLCGKGLSGVPLSTMGYEKRTNLFLKIDREKFISFLMKNLPEPPKDYEKIRALNKG